MATRHEIPLADGRRAKVVFTDSTDGDFSIHADRDGLDHRRAQIVASPWSWLRQVHGTSLFVVSASGEHAGADGDGLLTRTSNCPVSVTTADCAPVVFVAEFGMAVIHAGWRGLVGGILQDAAQAVVELAGDPISTILGPCISPSVYEFGEPELSSLVDRFGLAVTAQTTDGRPALDVAAAVSAACRQTGWPEPQRPLCTSDRRFFSHRVRSDRERMAAVVWIEEAASV